jgi:succinate-semialdehyde dehydrogenase/glutarate-semialdehyde dehydrogenase
MLNSINPSNGQVLATFDEISDKELDSRLDSAVKTQGSWCKTPLSERSKLLITIAEVLDSQQERWAELMTLEMGKTLKSARAEVVKCSLACRYYAENGPNFLRDEYIATESAKNYVRYLPLGVLLAVMPWNFPFWQLFRFLAPALMAGNSVVLKHSSNVPQCALAIEEVLRSAGAPVGLFQTLLIGAKRVAGVIADTRIAGVSMTGSEVAGRQVAQMAGANIKKCVLELGSNDAFIVMPSSDLEKAVQTAVQARVANNGQSCIAAKRFMIHRDLYPSFEQRFVELMKALKVGDPKNPATDVGPLATLQTLLDIESQVNTSMSLGANLLCGGKRPGESGYFYSPSVLSEITHESPIYHQEVFGPVAALFCINSLDEAVALVNASPYGLGSSCWTMEAEEQEQFINKLQTGMTFINSPVASDPRLPFGGIKLSGYGRELGRFGLLEFVNAKTVSIAL